MIQVAIIYNVLIFLGLLVGLIASFKFKQKSNIIVFSIYIFLDAIVIAMAIHTGHI